MNAYKPALFGVQCDAITKSGKRCTRRNRWEIPCIAVYDSMATSYRADSFRPVRLCKCHILLEQKLRKQGKRLKLHHGGWLGDYNRHHYGNLVISKPKIDWVKTNSFKVPKFWIKEAKCQS